MSRYNKRGRPTAVMSTDAAGKTPIIIRRKFGRLTLVICPTVGSATDTATA